MCIFVVEARLFKEIDGRLVIGIGIDEDHTRPHFNKLIAQCTKEQRSHTAATAIRIYA